MCSYIVRMQVAGELQPNPFAAEQSYTLLYTDTICANKCLADLLHTIVTCNTLR